MIQVRKLCALLFFSLMAAAAGASPGSPQAGKDYLVAAKPQPAEAGKKIEVIEFFGYFCPHCNAFDPVIATWVKKQGDKIAFKRIHVIFRDSMLAWNQAYVALESMGRAEQVHGRVFSAIHAEQQNIATEQQVEDFLVKLGIDRKQYQEALKSPAVQAKIKAGLQAQYAFGIDGVPMVVIDGRLITSPEIIRGSIGDQPEMTLHLATLQVMDALLAKVAKERPVVIGR